MKLIWHLEFHAVISISIIFRLKIITHMFMLSLPNRKIIRKYWIFSELLAEIYSLFFREKNKIRKCKHYLPIYIIKHTFDFFIPFKQINLHFTSTFPLMTASIKAVIIFALYNTTTRPTITHKNFLSNRVN